MEDHPILTLALVLGIAIAGLVIYKKIKNALPPPPPEPPKPGELKHRSPIMNTAIFAESAISSLNASPMIHWPSFITNL